MKLKLVKGFSNFRRCRCCGCVGVSFSPFSFSGRLARSLHFRFFQVSSSWGSDSFRFSERSRVAAVRSRQSQDWASFSVRRSLFRSLSTELLSGSYLRSLQLLDSLCDQFPELESAAFASLFKSLLSKLRTQPRFTEEELIYCVFRVLDSFLLLLKTKGEENPNTFLVSSLLRVLTSLESRRVSEEQFSLVYQLCTRVPKEERDFKFVGLVLRFCGVNGKGKLPLAWEWYHSTNNNRKNADAEYQPKTLEELNKGISYLDESLLWALARAAPFEQVNAFWETIKVKQSPDYPLLTSHFESLHFAFRHNNNNPNKDKDREAYESSLRREALSLGVLYDSGGDPEKNLDVHRAISLLTLDRSSPSWSKSFLERHLALGFVPTDRVFSCLLLRSSRAQNLGVSFWSFQRIVHLEIMHFSLISQAVWKAREKNPPPHQILDSDAPRLWMEAFKRRKLRPEPLVVAHLILAARCLGGDLVELCEYLHEFHNLRNEGLNNPHALETIVLPEKEDLDGVNEEELMLSILRESKLVSYYLAEKMFEFAQMERRTLPDAVREAQKKVYEAEKIPEIIREQRERAKRKRLKASREKKKEKKKKWLEQKEEKNNNKRS